MIIKILGTESLGVRGLSCSVELKDRKIVIDPGIALGWSRYGYLPHPFQVAIGAGVRKNIIRELQTASDVIISHFDGDHAPLYNANPYQLGLGEVGNGLSRCRLWAKGANHSPATQQGRRKALEESIGKEIPNAEGVTEGPMAFSAPVPHGQHDSEEHCVMMSRIEEDGVTFVHASDIQLLDETTIQIILAWKPTVVLASGPPIYRYTSSSFDPLKKRAWQNALELARHVETLIVDHHLLRCQEGVGWLDDLKRATTNRVLCAAEFMTRTPLFLESWRKELHSWLPVPENWHEAYKEKRADFNDYRRQGWIVLREKKKVSPCVWYDTCPIKSYSDRGFLETFWVDQYCLVNNNSCVRYQMEKAGESHPDNMLPDGTLRDDL